MNKHLILLAFIALAPKAYAEEPCDLGLENAYLNEYFCSELKEIAGTSLSTRGMTDETSTSEDGLDQQFAELQLFQDAFRTDPGKTLELIERIRNAGGLLAE